MRKYVKTFEVFHDNNTISILKGGDIKINNTIFTLRKIRDNQYLIDRVFVPIELRRKGEATTAIKYLTELAKKSNIILSVAIMSDDPSTDLGLRAAFLKAGFKPDESDGEVYPNDMTFIP